MARGSRGSSTRYRYDRAQIYARGGIDILGEWADNPRAVDFRKYSQDRERGAFRGIISALAGERGAETRAAIAADKAAARDRGRRGQRIAYRGFESSPASQTTSDSREARTIAYERQATRFARRELRSEWQAGRAEARRDAFRPWIAQRVSVPAIKSGRAPVYNVRDAGKGYRRSVGTSEIAIGQAIRDHQAQRVERLEARASGARTHAARQRAAFEAAGLKAELQTMNRSLGQLKRRTQ